jgi:asparagine synthase (glutamine-hydrolysing)
MLTLRARLEDADEECSISGKAIRFGSSYIEAFVSDQITMSVRDAPGGKEIWIGEDADPMPAAGSALPPMVGYRSFLDYEGIKILIHRVDGRPVIEIVRTAEGGCPVYVAADRGTLVASWKFEDAAQARPDPKPNVEACRIYLKHGQCQVRDMIIDGVSMLWPGESVIFSEEGLSFREVDTPDIVLPGTLSESARATDEFLRLIAEAMRINLAKSVQPLLELSGGLDSSCVAVAACSMRKGMNSYGVIHEGAMGAQQRKRRRELVDLLALYDFEAPSFEPPPFASLQVEECTFTPFDDNYRLPCVYAVDAHPAQYIDLVITGLGGDELTMENTFFRREWEVSGSICTSAVVSAVGRADMFMRRGIWPVHPLVNQSVVDFCRALPKKMRSGRLLNLLTLARSGLSDGFLFPRYYEHYGNVVQREAALFDFDSALVESVVADYGIVEFSPLLERAREATLRGFTDELITELYLLLKLETVLRRYVG